MPAGNEMNETCPLPVMFQLVAPLCDCWPAPMLKVNCVASLAGAIFLIVRKPLLGVTTHSEGDELGSADGYEQTLSSLAELPPKSASCATTVATVSAV